MPGQINTSLPATIELRVGPVDIRVATDLPAVHDGITEMYSGYPTPPDPFFDFHMRVGSPSRLRRWLRPQAVFSMDGAQPFKPLPVAQAFALFEWGFNWCISQFSHNWLIIHAAVLARDGKALVMPAPPGSGKSTLCAALTFAGWQLLSDELALVELDGHRILPIPRPISLKNRSIDLVRGFAPDACLSDPIHDTSKGTVCYARPPQHSIDRTSQAAMPSLFIFPQYDPDGPAISLEQRAPGESFLSIARNTFNFNVLGQTGFHTIQTLVDTSRCFDLRYHDLDQALPVIDQLISER